MDWLAPIGAAALTGVLSLAGLLLRNSTPRELQRAQELTKALNSMEQESAIVKFGRAVRDDQILSWALRATVAPSSGARALFGVLWGMSMTVAALAIVPLAIGIVAQAQGGHDQTAALTTLVMTAISGILLGFSVIPAKRHASQINSLRLRFRETWGLPPSMKMKNFDDPLPTPGQFEREYRHPTDAEVA